MKKRFIFVALAVVIAVAFWLNRPTIKNSSDPRLEVEAKPTPIDSNLQMKGSSRAIAADPKTAPVKTTDKNLIAAKKHLPWASEEELKTLIKQGINIENIERGRSPVTLDLGQLQLAVSQYYKMLGEYPDGGNLEVAKKLLGDNPKKVIFLDWLPKKISSSGEFLDPWNKPYEIKSTKEGLLSIRSAGPDLSFGTTDDQTMKP